MTETRWEEMLFRKNAVFIDEVQINTKTQKKRIRKVSNVKEIRIKPSGIKLNLIEGFGYESVLSHIVGAPCCAKSFTIPFRRTQSDLEIEMEEIREFEEEEEP